MCYPKPGPRCATYTRKRVAALEARTAEAAAAFATGEPSEGDPVGLARDLAAARDEHAESHTARHEAAVRINTMAEGADRVAAEADLAAAAARRAAKVAAYRATLSDQTGEDQSSEDQTTREDRVTVLVDIAVPAGVNPVEFVGELGEHELSHLGIFTATLADGRVVAHNTNGPNIVCPQCTGERDRQVNCAECAGRGMVGNVPYCPRNWDHVTEGLFLGGHDNQPGGGDARVSDQFDVVVSLYARDGYGPSDGVAHHTHEMIDGALDERDHDHIRRLATTVNEALDSNQTVLVRCLAGMNRSALVSGVALIQRGWTTDEAVSRMREVRSEYVLFNQHFVAFLRAEEARLASTRTRGRCTTCKGHQVFFGVPCETCAGSGYVAT